MTVCAGPKPLTRHRAQRLGLRSRLGRGRCQYRRVHASRWLWRHDGSAVRLWICAPVFLSLAYNYIVPAGSEGYAFTRSLEVVDLRCEIGHSAKRSPLLPMR